MNKIENQISRFENRGKWGYRAMLFPEDVTGFKPITRYVNWGTEVMGVSMHDKFEFFSPTEDDTHEATYGEIYKRYGGQKAFFGSGSKILDLGSGFGRATYELSRANRRSKLVGLDPKYLDENPLHKSPGYYVAGKGQELPFEDNSFTGILCCETFPRHVGDYVLLKNITEEVTRVSQIGAIWRATASMLNLGRMYYGESEKGPIGVDKAEAIKQVLLENGWEFYFNHRPGMYIARLTSKLSGQTPQ